MFFTFLAPYTYGALACVVWPEVARARDIRLFSSSHISLADGLFFGLVSVSAIAMVAQLWLEGFVWRQVFLYFNLVYFVFFSGGHRAGSFRTAQMERARASSPDRYREAGMRRLAMAIIMAVLPFTVPR